MTNLRDEPGIDESIGESSVADGSYFDRCIGEIEYKTLPPLFSTLKWLELMAAIWRKAGEVEWAHISKGYCMSKGKERGWLDTEVEGSEAGVDNNVEQQSSGEELLLTTSRSALSWGS